MDSGWAPRWGLGSGTESELEEEPPKRQGACVHRGPERSHIYRQDRRETAARFAQRRCAVHLGRLLCPAHCRAAEGPAETQDSESADFLSCRVSLGGVRRNRNKRAKHNGVGKRAERSGQRCACPVDSPGRHQDGIELQPGSNRKRTKRPNCPRSAATRAQQSAATSQRGRFGERPASEPRDLRAQRAKDRNSHRCWTVCLQLGGCKRERSEERRVGKECRSRW